MSLIQVVWGLAILAIIAASILVTGDTSYRSSRSVQDTAQLDALNESAINQAILILLDPRPDERWRAGQLNSRSALGGREARVSIQDEFGRVDINHADSALLERVFRVAGLSASDASQIVARVTAWRAKAATQLGSVQSDEKVSIGDVHPRHGAFESVDELKFILGMTEELYARVAPLLTVYSGHHLVDPNSMASEILTRMFQSTDRSGNAADVGSQLQPLSRQGRAFTIAVGTDGIEATFARSAVVRLSPSARMPFSILAWERSHVSPR